MNSSACLQLSPLRVMTVGTDRAASSEGTGLTARVLETLEHMWNSETIGGSLNAGRVALDDALDECSVENWDGYGAAPANELSAHWAGLVLEVLPSSIPVPEVAFHPAGDVILEWSPARGRVLSICIGSGGEVRFALRTPTAKFTGIETFSDGLPGGLAQALSSLVR